MRKSEGKISVIVWIALSVILFLLLRTTCSRIFRPPAVQFSDRGTSTPENLKTPLRGSVAVQNSGSGALYLRMVLTDADGRAIQSLTTDKGRPPAPKVEIFSEKGDKVYSCTLEYGWGGTCSHAWRVPGNLKGRFTARLTYDTRPYEITCSDTEFTIN